MVTPSIGKTVITGVHMQSANDAPDRDVKVVRIEGSNDEEIADYDSGNWQLITEMNVPAYTDRFQSQVLMFDNVWAFKHYRWIAVDTQGQVLAACRSPKLNYWAVVLQRMSHHRVMRFMQVHPTAPVLRALRMRLTGSRQNI